MTIAPRGARVGPARTIPGTGQASQPSLAIVPHSSALVAWSASPPGGVFGSPQLLPAQFSGAFMFTAGTRVTAVTRGSGDSRGHTAISRFVP